MNKVEESFFALLKAGLWEKDVQLMQYEKLDFNELLRLADEQSVIGLVAAGLEHVVDVKVSQMDFLPFVGIACQLEPLNTSMNDFINVLIKKMQAAGIQTLLVKGQGIAQCYERPLRRACGDIDLFLSDDNYTKAKNLLIPLATTVEPERVYNKHLGLTIGSWIVELHGSLRCGLSSRIDKVLDKIKDDVFRNGNVRSWKNGDTQVFLLNANDDVIYVFTHILNHFYKEGIGIRQICDWCRLLWTYKDDIDGKLLEHRLKKMGLITEWKAFGTFAVEYLGMPVEAMPLLDVRGKNQRLTAEGQVKDEVKWKKKAEMIRAFVVEVGNMGHNRDSSYFSKYPYVIRKAISLGRRVGDLYRHARIFPLNSVRFLPKIVFNGLRSAMRGE